MKRTMWLMIAGVLAVRHADLDAGPTERLRRRNLFRQGLASLVRKTAVLEPHRDLL